MQSPCRIQSKFYLPLPPNSLGMYKHNGIDCALSLRGRGESRVRLRKFERYSLQSTVSWDFFSEQTGKKRGHVLNISTQGCLLKTSEHIDSRRWLRLFIHPTQSNVSFTLVGKVVRKRTTLELVTDEDVSLYQYGIGFTYPAMLSDQVLDLILALSNKNLSVRSCLNRNAKSSLRPGFLA